MRKITKEVNFGKAIARITVRTEMVEKFADGQKYAEVKEAKTLIEIVAPNGKVVTDGIDVTAIGERVIVGKAETQGYEIYENIKNTIEEMKKEVLEEEEDNKEEIEIAQQIVKEAEEKGVKNLMTNKEYQEWAKKYNNLVNEGGEGYLPKRVTKEQYQRAREILG